MSYSYPLAKMYLDLIEALILVRKQVPNTRITMVMYVLAVGELEACTAKEAGMFVNRKHKTAYLALNIGVRAGYLVKIGNNKYMLSDKGKRIYNKWLQVSKQVQAKHRAILLRNVNKTKSNDRD